MRQESLITAIGGFVVGGILSLPLGGVAGYRIGQKSVPVEVVSSEPVKPVEVVRPVKVTPVATPKSADAKAVMLNQPALSQLYEDFKNPYAAREKYASIRFRITGRAERVGAFQSVVICLSQPIGAWGVTVTMRENEIQRIKIGQVYAIEAKATYANTLNQPEAEFEDGIIVQ